MSKFDYSQLDGRLLKLLLAVMETGSITRAADKLGVTQSAVSHLLDKLREITGDPLFVKSGRGIVATDRAEALVAPARELLSAMENFATSGPFNPAHWQTTFTVAANDFQRDVLLPPLMARLRTRAPGVSLRVIPSDIPDLDMLRHESCQLVISPRPPDGADIVQKRLFEDEYRVFYDADHRLPPVTREDYLSAEHVTVMYGPHRHLDLDQWLETQGIRRNFRVMVPGFAGLPSFIRATSLVATVPGLLRTGLLHGLASIRVPVTCPTMPMYMIWHKRHQHDASHRWLRGELEACTPRLAPGCND